MTKAKANGVRLYDRLVVKATGQVGHVYSAAKDAEDAIRLADGCDCRGQWQMSGELRYAAHVGGFPWFYLCEKWYSYSDLERETAISDEKRP